MNELLFNILFWKNLSTDTKSTNLEVFPTFMRSNLLAGWLHSSILRLVSTYCFRLRIAAIVGLDIPSNICARDILRLVDSQMPKPVTNSKLEGTLRNEEDKIQRTGSVGRQPYKRYCKFWQMTRRTRFGEPESGRHLLSHSKTITICDIFEAS